MEFGHVDAEGSGLTAKFSVQHTCISTLDPINATYQHAVKRAEDTLPLLS